MKVERIYWSELLNRTKGYLWTWEASEKAGKNWSKAQVEELVILDRRDILLWTGKKARISVNIEGLSVCSQSGWRFPMKCRTMTSCWSPFPTRDYKFIVILSAFLQCCSAPLWKRVFSGSATQSVVHKLLIWGLKWDKEFATGKLEWAGTVRCLRFLGIVPWKNRALHWEETAANKHKLTRVGI